MTKRYRETIDVHTSDLSVQIDGTVNDDESPTPKTFTWREGHYRVLAVLGHWREDAAYWAGGGVEVPQRDLWRVEAQNGTPTRGIYELVCEGAPDGGTTWRLDRVWD